MGNCSTNIQHPGLCFHRNEGLLHPPGEEEHAAEVLVEGKGSVERVVEEGGSHDDQIIPGEEMEKQGVLSVDGLTLSSPLLPVALPTSFE